MRYLKNLLAFSLLVLAATASAGQFHFADLQGKEQRLADYKGKWVLVNFWATWCPPCLEEIPDLVDLYNDRKDKDFAIIGIAMSSSRDSVMELTKQMDMSYPVVMGNDRMAAQFGKIEALPTSFLFDPEGKLVGYQPGAISRKAIENYINTKGRK